LEAEYPAIAERARRLAPQLFDLLGIRFLTLHLEKSPPLLIQFVEDVLPVTLIDEWQGADWSGALSTIRLYQVDPSPVATIVVDFALPDAQMFLAEGWSPVGVAEAGRYATRPSVDLILPALPNGAQITLTYAQPITVSYRHQGYDAGKQQGNIHTLILPPQSDGEPTSRLRLNFLDAPSPISELVPTATPIGRTGTSLAPGVAILTQSAGEEVGDLAHLWVNGVDYASNQRGYNLVALRPTGEVLGSATFDTMMPTESVTESVTESTTESGRMAEWLNRWESGTVIAGAVADTAENDMGTSLGEKAISALQRLGVAGDLRGKFRWSHAFIGVVDAPPASAVEEIQLIHPAAVWAGVPLPAAAGYGALQSMTLTRN
jgi:hypothetical protein